MSAAAPKEGTTIVLMGLRGSGKSTLGKRLAERLGRVDAQFAPRLRRLLVELGLPVDVPAVDHAALVDVMARDKKAEHGRLRFVLPSRLGHVELVGDVPRELVAAALGE